MGPLTVSFVMVKWAISPRSIDGQMGGPPKIGVFTPPNHPLKNRVFHDFHHPFWGKKTILETPKSGWAPWETGEKDFMLMLLMALSTDHCSQQSQNEV